MSKSILDYINRHIAISAKSQSRVLAEDVEDEIYQLLIDRGFSTMEAAFIIGGIMEHLEDFAYQKILNEMETKVAKGIISVCLNDFRE